MFQVRSKYYVPKATAKDEIVFKICSVWRELQDKNHFYRRFFNLVKFTSDLFITKQGNQDVLIRDFFINMNEFSNF